MPVIKRGSLSASTSTFSTPVIPGSSGITVTTGALSSELTFQNTSGSSTPSQSFVSFGQAFRKGDVPFGNTPQLTTVSGTVIPAQFDLRNNWSDGSLRWCEISCVLPSIAANGSLAIRLGAVTGSFNNAQYRSLSDISGTGCNPTVSITNCTDYLGTTFMGGSQSASFSSAAAQGGIYLEKVKSGPVCDQWKAWMFFPGQPSGGEQLAVWFYVTAWTNQSSGALATISHIAKVHNGWMNKTSPTNYRYDATYSDGVAISRNFTSSNTFSFAGGTFNEKFTSTAHGLQTNDPVTLTTTNTLPSGLTTTDVWYVAVPDANTISFAGGSPSQMDGTPISSNTGTGTHTWHRRTFHTHWTSWFTCRADGKSDWTSSEATIFVAQNVTYLHSTGMLPPVDLNVTDATFTTDHTPSAVSNGPWNYSQGNCGRIRAAIDSGGIVDMTGWIPGWCIRAFKNQTSALAQDARACALMTTSMPVHVLNEATGKVPTYRGIGATPHDVYGASGNYTGLGTQQTTTWYFDHGNSGGLIEPAGDDGGYVATTGWDWSHVPDPIYYVVVTEGGCHLLEAHLLLANGAPLRMGQGGSPQTGYQAVSRIIQIDVATTYYYNIIVKAQQPRSNAWMMRTWSYALAICPDSWVEKPYFADTLAGNFAFVKDYIQNATASTTNFRALGAWQFANPFEQLYMHSYLSGAFAMAYKLHGDANVNWVLSNHLLNRFTGYLANLHDHFTQFNYSTYNSWTVSGSNNAFNSPQFVGWSDVGGFPTEQLGADQWNFSWTSGNANFTMASVLTANIWYLAVNDRFMWPLTVTPPGGFNQHQWYYVVATNFTPGSAPSTLGGHTFQLSATLGGAAIAPTNTSSFADTFGVSWSTEANLPTVTDFDTAYSLYSYTYLDVGLGAANIMKACGITGLDPFLTAYTQYQAGTTYNNKQLGQANFKMQSTFGAPYPDFYYRGTQVYVNTNSVGGDGTTRALTGPHAAFSSLYLALGNMATDLTGTLGMTFWCAGGRETINSSVAPFYENKGLTICPMPPVGAGGFGNWTTTATGSVRCCGDPLAPDGRNYGSKFDFNKYHLAFTGQGPPTETTSGGPFYIQSTNVYLDGLQFYINGTNINNYTVKFAAIQDGPFVYRNNKCDITNNSTSYLTSGIVYPGGTTTNQIDIENNVFHWHSAYYDENAFRAFSNTATGTTVNFINNTVSGPPIMVVVGSGVFGTYTIKNNVYLNKMLGVSDTFGTVVDQSAGDSTFHVDYNASEDGAGTNAITWTSTNWPSNFTDYVNGDFTVKDTGASIYASGVAGVAGQTIDGVGNVRKLTPNRGAWENI